MAQANPLTLDSSAKKLTAGTAPMTAGPVSIAAWVNRAAAGSFGRFYAWICASGSNNEGFVLGEDINGSSGNGRGLTYHSGNKAGGTTSSAVQNSTWNHVLSTHAGGSGAVSTYVRGANKGTTASTYTPSGLNAFQINGRPSDATNGIGGAIGDVAIWNRILSDTEALYLANGGNPRYLQSLINFWHVNSTGATETDLTGSINLTVAGTPSAAASAPTVTTYWTAASLGNQSYTQGSAITSIDLTTKVDNNGLSTYTGAIKQLSSGTNATTANGAGTTARELIVNAIGSFAAGDFVSIGAGNPTPVLQVNGSTILMGSDQTWNNGDQVNRYTVGAAGFTGNGNLTVSANVFSGTPGAADVGTYNNCVFQFTSGSAPLSFSNLFSITVASSGAAPSFTAGPTLTTRNTDGYTYGATCNQTATLHMGVYLKGSATPSVANVKAGAGTGFQFHTTAALTAATPGSISATGLTLPFYDVYFVVSNGSGDSALASNLAVFKAPPAGKQYTSLTILPITGITKANPANVTQVGHGRSTGDQVEIFGVGGMTQANGLFGAITKVDNDHYTLNGVDSTGFSTYTSGGDATWGQSLIYNASTRLVTGDVLIVDATTREAGSVVNVRPDGSISYPGPLTRQSVQADAYSVSGGALLGAALSYLNNVPPITPNIASFTPIILPLNQGASVNIANYFGNPQGDILSISASGLPTGLAISTPNLTGAPTARAITLPSFTATDAANESTSVNLPVIAGNVDVPSVLGLDQPAVIRLLQASYLTAQFGTQDDATVGGPAAAGLAIIQSPVTGTLPPNSVINVTLSSGNAPPVIQAPVVTLLAKDSEQITYGIQPPPLLSPVVGASRFENLEVCLAGPTDGSGQVYRFFRLASDSRITDLGLLNDANPTNSTYNCGLFNEDGTPIQRGSDAVLFRGLSLDGVRSTWNSVYTPALLGGSASLANSNKALWQLLNLPRDPRQVWLVGMIAVTPGSVGGAIVLRVSYIR